MTGWLAGAIPVALSLSLFWPATGYDFINFDDPIYVSENPHLRSGISAEGIRWAFNVGYAGNWHPLTWLSHMLDVEWFGLDAGAHHRTGVLLHALNALLLFLLLRRLLLSDAETRLDPASIAAAASLGASIFAIHPQRLESVVWISERKDLLSGALWMLTTLAYLAYVRRGDAWRYLGVVALLALGLTAKAMAVTLPFVLLMLDVWPLRRIRPGRRMSARARVDLRRAILDKLPLLLLALGAAWITLRAQRAGGAVGALEILPLATRLSNAVVAYVAYLADACWPLRLSVFYPYPPAGWAPSLVLLSGSILIAITVAALVGRARRPWVLAGWSWYLLVLLPVIGLLHVGMHSRADRYTYLPHVGLCIVVAWFVARAWQRRGLSRVLVGTGGALLLVTLFSATREQLPYWRNTEALFARAAVVTPGNYLAHYSLSVEYARLGDLDEAVEQASLAVAMHPGYSRAYDHLGYCLAAQGHVREGLEQIRKAIRLRPDDPGAYLRLGGVLLSAGRESEAISPLRRALTLDPARPEGYAALGLALAALERQDEAEQAYRRALQLDPAQFEARRGLGELLLRRGEPAQAYAQLQAALTLRPDDAGLLASLARLDLQRGDRATALERQRRLQSIDAASGERLRRQIETFRAGEEAEE